MCSTTTSTHPIFQMCCGRWALAYIRICAKSTGRSRYCRGISATPKKSGTAGGGPSSYTTDYSPPSRRGRRAQPPSTASTRPRYANVYSPPSHTESNHPRSLVNWPNEEPTLVACSSMTFNRGSAANRQLAWATLHLASTRRCPHPSTTGITGYRTAIQTLQIGRDGLPAVGHAEFLQNPFHVRLYGFL